MTPITYFNDGGGVCGGGGGRWQRPKDYFGSEVLAKRDFLGLWKTPGFYVSLKNTGSFPIMYPSFISSNQ